jgi:hypothetical protein
VHSAELIVGYRLVADERTDALPAAVAVALPIDQPGREPR